MKYYSFFISDYTNATFWISDQQDLIYRRLLDVYYDSESPLSRDLNVIFRKIRMKKSKRNFADLEFILTTYFEKTDEGWSHKKCNYVINEFRKKSKINQVNGRKGGRPKKEPNGFVDETDIEPEEKRSTTEEEAGQNLYKIKTKIKTKIKNNNTPLTPLGGDCVVSSPDPELEGSENQNAPKKPERVKTKTPDRPPGVSEQVWSDFLAHRKSHRASLTETALRAIEREAGIAGMSLDAALTECVVRGWRGFKAEWMVSQKKPTRDLEPVTRGPDFDYTEGGL